VASSVVSGEGTISAHYSDQFGSFSLLETGPALGFRYIADADNSPPHPLHGRQRSRKRVCPNHGKSLTPAIRPVVEYRGRPTSDRRLHGDADGSEVVTLATSRPTVGRSVMVCLALSSHPAPEYATRGPPILRRVAGARASRPLLTAFRRRAAAPSQPSALPADAAQPDQRRTSTASTAPRAAKPG
jgi:hypothetical protein